MVVSYFGDGCFRVQSGELSLLTNPISSRLKADVVLKTLTLVEALASSPQSEIAFPGEYEIKGIEIRGLPLERESSEKFLKTVYAVNWEEIRFLFLGHLSKFPEVELIEELGKPDVVFVPIGDSHFISASEAAKLIRQLEPAVVIPSFYKTPGEFLKIMGGKAEPQEKFVFKKKDLAESKRQVVVLESKSEKG